MPKNTENLGLGDVVSGAFEASKAMSFTDKLKTAADTGLFLAQYVTLGALPAAPDSLKGDPSVFLDELRDRVWKEPSKNFSID